MSKRANECIGYMGQENALFVNSNNTTVAGKKYGLVNHTRGLRKTYSYGVSIKGKSI